MRDVDDTAAKSNGVIHVTYNVLLVRDGDAVVEVSRQRTTGLCQVEPDAVVVFTGIHTGLVNVAVETRSVAPRTVDMADWDEVADVDFRAERGNLTIASLGGDVPASLSELTPPGPATYRVRIHARGRDSDGAASEPSEDYLFIIWPTESKERLVIYKETDQAGALRRSMTRDLSESSTATRPQPKQKPQRSRHAPGPRQVARANRREPPPAK